MDDATIELRIRAMEFATQNLGPHGPTDKVLAEAAAIYEWLRAGALPSKPVGVDAVKATLVAHGIDPRSVMKAG